MVATIKQLVRRSKISGHSWLALGLIAIEFLAVYELAWRGGSWLFLPGGLWPLAAIIVLAVELRSQLLVKRGAAGGRTMTFWKCLPGLIIGLSVTLIVAMVPRRATQIVIALFYAAWLLWRERDPERASTKLAQLLIVQAVMFEAIFLVAAVWPSPGGSTVPGWIILILVWSGAYFSVYGALKRRGDNLAGVIAATWGVIATEVAWVLQLWLITYTMKGGYVMVPQPALILTALAYIFGSILVTSRQGKLSRGRLGEYMMIAVLLVIIVVAGTSWRGNI